jgi:DNA polymerase III sliding clamp (beta) subunit (PCNA family)
MKYESKCQLDLIVGSEIRNLDKVLFDKENQSLVSTNGSAIAVVPCQVEKGDPEKALLPSGVVKELRIKNRSKGESTLKCNDGNLEYEGRNGNGVIRNDELSRLYPKWKRIIEDVPDYLESEKSEKSISINPKLLLDLSKALGSENAIKLIPYGKGRIKVVPHGDRHTNKLGVLMGLRNE